LIRRTAGLTGAERKTNHVKKTRSWPPCPSHGYPLFLPLVTAVEPVGSDLSESVHHVSISIFRSRSGDSCRVRA
ncbi:MAG: hypothetical protein AAF412_08175, partial [Pseudomonadota bacterium]